MTGSGEDVTAGIPSRQQPSVQRQATTPAVQPTEAVDPDQERIEIPAFLRRQAN